MGLANLVPGISGGTMILAIGLYDRFISAVADVTRLRFERPTLIFLGILALGLGGSILSLSGVAVALVTDHSWVAYSLFVGLTLGGVPMLARLSQPCRPGVVVAVAAGVGVMAALAWKLSGTQLPETMPVLLAVGALAASSMILPGISGSYVLLILGLYDLVIGSLSIGAVREDFWHTVRVIGPVVVGAALGIGLLSNVLKWFLNRHSAVCHGALLGLLLGSVLGLWPFQEPTNPDLADKRVRRAVVMLVEGENFDAVRDRLGDEDLDDARQALLRETYKGKTRGELKAAGEDLKYFTPGLSQVASALGLLLAGFVTTRLLGGRSQ